MMEAVPNPLSWALKMCSVRLALLELFALHSNFQEINTRFGAHGEKDVASLLHSMQSESKDSSEATQKDLISGACKFRAAEKTLNSTFALVNKVFSRSC